MTFDKFSDMIFPVKRKRSFCRGLQQQFFYMIKAGKASKSFPLLLFISIFSDGYLLPAFSHPILSCMVSSTKSRHSQPLPFVKSWKPHIGSTVFILSRRLQKFPLPRFNAILTSLFQRNRIDIFSSDIPNKHPPGKQELKSYKPNGLTMIKETERRFSPLTDNPGTERKAYNAKPPSEEEGFMSVRQTPKIIFLPERQLPWPSERHAGRRQYGRNDRAKRAGNTVWRGGRGRYAKLRSWQYSENTAGIRVRRLHRKKSF